MKDTEEENQEQLTREELVELKRMLNDYRDLKNETEKQKEQLQIEVKKPPKPNWLEGADYDFERRREEEHNYSNQPVIYKTSQQTRVDPTKNKVWIGVMCAFLPLIVALIVGFAVYKTGTEERRTFWKGFGIAIACAFVVGAFLGLILGLAR